MSTIVASPAVAPSPAELLAEHDAAIDACAFKDDSLCTPEERMTRLFEYRLCSTSYLRFRRWAKLAEAPPPGCNTGGGVIPFATWPHTQTLISSFLNDKMVAILKSRQIGVSWETAAYCLWQALFKSAFKALLFSKGLVEASELLAKCRFVYDHLPNYMRLKLGADSKTEMGFPDQNSVIMALPATQSAGVSFTASVIVYDEWEQHEYAEQNFANAKPVIDAGGQVIGVFTRDPFKAITLARQIFIDAQAGKNKWRYLFFGWRSRPGRTQEWYNETKESIPNLELGTLTPDLYMRTNYPDTVEEALAPLQTVSACDQTVLERMREDTRSTIKVVQDGLDQGMCNIFKDYSTGAFYVAGTDTSHGTGNDDSATVIINIKTGEIVADILDSRIPPEQLAVHSVKLLEYYHNPLWYIEDNDWGATTIKVAQSLNYRNLGRYFDASGKEDANRVGWHTGTANRDLLWGMLIPAINNRQLVIYNAKGLAQFRDLIRNSKAGGRIEAMSGRHDDYPMAVGIAWYNRDQVSTGVSSSKPIRTLTFRNRR